MKVKIKNIIIGVIYFLVASALSLFKPIGEIIPAFSFDYAVRWTIILFSAALFTYCAKKIYCRYIFSLIFIVCFVVILRLLLDLNAGRNVYKELNANCVYFYVVLTVPVYYILKNRVVSLESFVDKVIILSTLSYLLRTLISTYYTVFGDRIFYDISIESAAENWFRNGILRVNPPCFGIIIIALCMYRIYEEKAIKRRLPYFMVIAISLYYSLYVHCARALIIYQLAELIFLIIIKKRNSFKQLLIISIGLFAVVLFFSGGFFDSLLDMFSTSNTTYWFSNQSRLLTYPYYFNMFLENFVLGTGFLAGDELYFQSSIITGGIGDVGILRSLVQLGSGILIFYVLFFGKNIIVSCKALKKSKTSNMYILVCGITISYMFTCINVDCFYPIYAFSIPVSIAIVVFAENSLKSGNCLCLK